MMQAVTMANQQPGEGYAGLQVEVTGLQFYTYRFTLQQFPTSVA